MQALFLTVMAVARFNVEPTKLQIILLALVNAHGDTIFLQILLIAKLNATSINNIMEDHAIVNQDVANSTIYVPYAL
jgi:hypothetical protein